MKSAITGLTILIIGLSSTIASAADYSAYLKQHKGRINAEVKRTEKIHKTAQFYSKKLRKHVFAAAKKSDPKNFARFQTEAKKLQRSRLTGKKKNRAMVVLNEKYRPLFDSVARTVKLDAKEYHSKMRRFAHRLDAQYVISDLYTSLLEWASNKEEEEDDPGQVNQEFVISGNYDLAINEKNGHLVALITSLSNIFNGSSEAGGFSIYAGGFSAEASVAKIIDVPAGYDRIRVSLLARVSGQAHAIAIAGGATFSASQLLEIASINFDDVYCSKIQPVNTAIAPIIWHNLSDVDTLVNMSCEIDLNQAPQSLMLVSGVLATGLAAGNGGGSIFHDQNSLSLTVQLIND